MYFLTGLLRTALHKRSNHCLLLEMEEVFVMLLRSIKAVVFSELTSLLQKASPHSFPVQGGRLDTVLYKWVPEVHVPTWPVCSTTA